MLNLSDFFLSRGGEWWDTGLIIFAAIAGFGTVGVGVFTTGSIFAHKRESVASGESLSNYKVSAEEKVALATASGIEAGRKAGEASGIAEKAKADVAIARAQAALSNEKAAEANARAQEARLALAEFAAPRVLNMEKKQRLVNSLKTFAGTPFAVSIQTSGEALDFERQLVDVLRESGWRQQPTPSGTVYTVPGQPALGVVSLTGIAIYIDDGKSDLFPAVMAASSALKREGFAIDAKRIIDGSEAVKDAIHIYIGEKPRS